VLCRGGVDCAIEETEMFIGHIGVAFAAKPAARAVSLGTLFVACQLADLVWPVLVVAGIERVAVTPGLTAVTPLDFLYYPFSHSLIASLLWAAAFAGGYVALRRAPARVGLVVGLVAVSHWMLDAISHRPDLPLTLGASSARIGLGLWHSVPATILVEGALFAAGLWMYVRATTPRDRTGSWALWSLVALLVVIYAANLFGPPPPDGMAAASGAFALWLLVAWAYWIDRHRTAA
jgi:hypothetical protein